MASKTATRTVTVRTRKGVTRKELAEIRAQISWDKFDVAIAPRGVVTCENPF